MAEQLVADEPARGSIPPGRSSIFALLYFSISRWRVALSNQAATRIWRKLIDFSAV
jgi:hypothetical protein